MDFCIGTSAMNLSSTLQHTPDPALRAASVRLSRQVAAAPQRVFDAWLTAGGLRALLFGGEPGEAVSVELDPRVGGGFRIVQQLHGEEVEYSGEYLEIDRPHLLVFSLFVERYAQWDDRVIVELAPLAAHSLLVVTHELSSPSALERGRIHGRWARGLDGLAAHLHLQRWPKMPDSIAGVQVLG